MHVDSKISEYLDQLASKASTPGGGSVAALAGATGAALLSMVCNLTIGKDKYKNVEEENKRVLADATELRAELTRLIDEDSKVLGDLMAAYGLPRGTDREKEERAELIQTRSKIAVGVPLRAAQACRRVIDLSTQEVEIGTSMAISDVGVAVLMAEAGLRAAILNIEINLAAIKDEAFVKEIRSEVESIIKGSADVKEQVYSQVVAKL